MAKRSFNRPSRDWQQYPSVQLPEVWPLATNIQARNTDFDKDARIINGYAEYDPQTEDFNVEKRPGFGQVTSFAVGTGRGHFNWRPNTGMIGIRGIYSVIGASIYKNGALHGAVSGAGLYVFEPMIEGPYLFLSNGIAAYYTDGTTLTLVNDVDFPASFCPGSAYLNGRMYVLRYDGGIQGSDVGAPNTWQATNLIFARSYPDGGVAITRQLNYIVALKQWSTEFFEDVGNPTGSVLARVDGAMLNYGCSDERTLVDFDGVLLWVTASENGAPQVGRMDNLNFQIISTPPIERLLKTIVNFAIINVSAFPLKVAGHRFYVLNIESLEASLVYDLDQKMWFYWTDADNNSAPWPFVSATVFSNQALLQRLSNGQQVQCDADYVFSTDNTTVFPVDIYTPNFDYGVDREKQLNVLRFNCDQTPGSEMKVRYSDDDYRSYSNFRTIDLSIERPIGTDWGSFYRRSFHFRHQAATPFRIKSVALQIDIGSS